MISEMDRVLTCPLRALCVNPVVTYLVSTGSKYTPLFSHYVLRIALLHATSCMVIVCGHLSLCVCLYAAICMHVRPSFDSYMCLCGRRKLEDGNWEMRTTVYGEAKLDDSRKCLTQPHATLRCLRHIVTETNARACIRTDVPAPPGTQVEPWQTLSPRHALCAYM